MAEWVAIWWQPATKVTWVIALSTPKYRRRSSERSPSLAEIKNPARRKELHTHWTREEVLMFMVHLRPGLASIVIYQHSQSKIWPRSWARWCNKSSKKTFRFAKTVENHPCLKKAQMKLQLPRNCRTRSWVLICANLCKLWKIQRHQTC